MDTLITDQKILDLFSTKNAGQVFIIRFKDGTEERSGFGKLDRVISDNLAWLKA